MRSNFVVDKARDAAWEKAEDIVAFQQRGDERRARRVTDRLDRDFGLTARLLLLRL